MILILGLLGVVIGAALIRFARKGRVIDDHPICAKCKFDLYGRPPSSARCSECGTDLQLNGAIKTGNRKTRVAPLAAGALLLALCGIVTLWLSIIGITGWNYLPYAPTWIVISQAHSADIGSSRRAFAELDHRIGSPSTDSIVEAALRAQADHATRWDARWGDLVEHAKVTGSIRPIHWDRYLSQAPVFDRITLRSRLAADEAATVWLAGIEIRMGNYPGMGIRAMLTSTLAIENGSTRITTVGPHLDIRDTPVYFGSALFRFSPKDTQLLGIGSRDVILVVQWDLLGAGTYAGTGHSQLEMRLPLSVLPRGQPSVRLLNRSDLGAAIQNCMSVGQYQNGTQPDGKKYFRAQIRADHPPLDLAFEAVAQTQGYECSLGDFYFRANQDCLWGCSASFDLKDLPLHDVDIILRPSARVAGDTPDLFDIYGGEIRLKAHP